MNDGFFAVGVNEWQAACDLGLNPACALLVMARGTLRDNVTTKWSANAIEHHAGVHWRRANEAIQTLSQAGLVTFKQRGQHPCYAISKPEDSEKLIWLPNALVTGAADEVPPLARLRSMRDLDALRLLIDLYHHHELTGDGGLPRSMLIGKFTREHVCERGRFDVYGFTYETATAHRAGPLTRYWTKGNREENPVWSRLNVLTSMGLLERIDYLAEDGDPDAELIHALTGDSHANQAADAASTFVERLPGGFRYVSDRFQYVLPVPRNSKQTVVGVFRLLYRPKTKRTAAWFGRHAEACKAASELYMHLAVGNFDQQRRVA